LLFDRHVVITKACLFKCMNLIALSKVKQNLKCETQNRGDRKRPVFEH